jgi:hypothetical protein
MHPHECGVYNILSYTYVHFLVLTSLLIAQCAFMGGLKFPAALCGCYHLKVSGFVTAKFSIKDCQFLPYPPNSVCNEDAFISVSG